MKGEQHANEVTRTQGETLGKEWAKTAGKRRLNRLARDVSANGGIQDFVDIAGNEHNDGVYVNLANAIEGKNGDGDYMGWDEAREYWEGLIVAKFKFANDWEVIEDPDFACGFISGALDVLDKIDRGN